MDIAQPKHSVLESRPTDFATTHWSLVLNASGAQSPFVASALEQLCVTYWYPLYAHVRRLGWGPQDAQDLTQDFFARLLEKDYLKLADPKRGRFRTFLLTSIARFVANEWERRHAVKRGAGQTVPLVVMENGEERYRHEPVDGLSPDIIFERRWATTLLESVIGRLRVEYASVHKEELFEGLKASVWGEAPEDGYPSLAAKFNLSEGALRVAAHRMRERYRTLLHETVARTVATTDEVEDELRHLASVLRE